MQSVRSVQGGGSGGDEDAGGKDPSDVPPVASAAMGAPPSATQVESTSSSYDEEILECMHRLKMTAQWLRYESEGLPPQQLFGVKCAVAPIRCAEAMILEWMAEPRVGVLMDLGRIRSRLPAILAATGSLVYPAIIAQLGAGRQVENDCVASMLVQVLGVKESADLQEGFGALMQNLLSGGLEKAHAAEKGSEGAGGMGAEKTHEEEGGIRGETAEKAQGEEGWADGEVMDRGGGMEKEEEQGVDDAGDVRDGREPNCSSEASRGEDRRSSRAANGAAKKGWQRGEEWAMEGAFEGACVGEVCGWHGLDSRAWWWGRVGVPVQPLQ
ncbi:unnamed protein product [Closterium sp. NIES-64]|nr:unnamed protein product [Closterium sp. NIES-64]